MHNVNYLAHKFRAPNGVIGPPRIFPLLLWSAVGLLLKNSALTGVSGFLSCNFITFTAMGWRATKKKLIGGMRQLGQELGQGQNKSEVSSTALWLWRERSGNFNGRR